MMVMMEMVMWKGGDGRGHGWFLSVHNSYVIVTVEYGLGRLAELVSIFCIAELWASGRGARRVHLNG